MSESAPMTGDLKTLVRISFPIMLFLFCETLTAFVERIFLSYYSIEAVHASLNATYLATIFQSPCIAIAAMGQVFVGLYQGSKEQKKIGSCVWQMIWFSLLSILLTLPLSYGASFFYFKDTIVAEAGTEYFTILALGNFLFPLNMALSSFYLGRGKTSLVTTLLLGSYAINLLLSWALIFGIEGIVPSLGVQGAALAKCYSLGLLCGVFFWFFLSQKNREMYGTNCWQLSLPALWSYIRPGLVRAFGYFSGKICWVAVTYLMIKKGDAYLNVVTIGGTIVLFLNFITTGIYRAVLTIASNLIGAKNYQEVWRLCRSSMIYISLITAALAFPLLLFPNSMIYFFDSSYYALFKDTFGAINHWIWLYIVVLTVQLVFCGVIVAARDLKFQLYTYLLFWLTTFFPTYFIIDVGGQPPRYLWSILTLEGVFFAALFFFRFLQRRWEKEEIALKN